MERHFPPLVQTPESVFHFILHSALRAEGLKESQSKSAATHTQDKAGSSGAKPSTTAASGAPVRQFFPLGPDFSLHDRPQPQPMRAVQSSDSQGQRYTSEEIEVLR